MSPALSWWLMAVLSPSNPAQYRLASCWPFIVAQSYLSRAVYQELFYQELFKESHLKRARL
jgi:hypothetical protein